MKNQFWFAKRERKENIKLCELHSYISSLLSSSTWGFLATVVPTYFFLLFLKFFFAFCYFFSGCMIDINRGIYQERSVYLCVSSWVKKSGYHHISYHREHRLEDFMFFENKTTSRGIITKLLKITRHYEFYDSWCEVR